ncbi:MAG: SDR family oxidoreductase [Planctomycetota bacterium]|nr:MAG: SDR family oxidoreductase [Planctomycetota bacterium]
MAKTPAEFLEELFGLSGQTAVVIGGAGELGGALCAGLMQAGANVVVADLNEQACQSRVEKLREHGDHVRYVTVDVTKRSSLENLLNEAKQVTGRVEILVNCAGINLGTPFLEHDPAKWDQIMAVNLKGTFEACQVFIPHMLEIGGGSILNIGSVTSHLPLSKVFAYAASKAGVVNLTRGIAQEFGDKGIRVNAICPGFFPAEQNRKLLDQERIDNIMKHTPMHRFGEPHELVGAALCLLSPKAGSYITGAAFNVDGGFTCAWF